MGRGKLLAAAVILVVVVGGYFVFSRPPAGPSEQDAAPFKKAVEAYLKRKSMEMAVVRFKSLDLDDKGTTAEADVVLKEKEGIHNLTTTWRFEFRKKARATGGGRGSEESAGWEVVKRVR